MSESWSAHAADAILAKPAIAAAIPIERILKDIFVLLN
jgi:hypothetical protein